MSRQRVTAILTLAAALAAAGLATVPAAATGAVYVVDGSSSTCSDEGVGSTEQPYCTIGAAMRRGLVAGDTVRIAPAIYREQVTVPVSGAAGSPLTLEATAPGVLVLGTRYLGDATWSPTSPSTTSWQTPYAPPSAPRQVFLSGVRLAQAASASALRADSWFYDAGAKVLMVDFGGQSPAGRAVEAGAQSYGVSVVGRRNVAVKGLVTRGANMAGIRIGASSAVDVLDTTADQGGTNGILVESSSSNVVLDSSTATRASSTGIKVSASTAVTVRRSVADRNGLHGIGVSGSSQTVLMGNSSHHNESAGTASAAGIDVSGSSPDGRVIGNTAWSNQDTGIQLGSGSRSALVARNVSHHNGDHGLHLLGATGASLLNNTSAENQRDGLLLEGGSTGARLANNLLSENGRTTGGYNLRVDAASLTGLAADHDLAWSSGPRNSVKAGAVAYRTLLSYAAASGQEAHALSVDPRFADSAGGDFSLAGGSVAVDSADAGVPGFVADDRWAPVDDPAVPDRGAGAPPYADRGAYERTADGTPNHAPHATLFLDPAQSSVPPSATVSVDASGSSDPDTFPVESYSFDFGDGTTGGPQPGAVTSHVFAAPGTYTVTVTVTDTAGASDTAQATAVVSARQPVTYRVDRANGVCADSGPGTAERPFCTINAGTKKALAGDTVRVAAGTYPEQVTVPNSGGAGAPLSIVGDPGASVSGANPATGAPGARNYGFLLRGISYINLSGFAVTGAAAIGVLLDGVDTTVVRDVEVSGNGSHGVTVNRSSSVVIERADAHHNGSIGIRFLNVTDSDVQGGKAHHNAFHGVSVQSSTRVAVHDVSAYANDRPTNRSATGIDVSAGSVDTLVEGCRTWGNDDSGIEAYTDASRTVIRRNISWANGDHGIDNYRAPGSVVVSNTVVGNATAGVNLEGGSSGATVRNNVALDNAVGSTRTVGEIRVDETSTAGTTLDHDLVFQTAGGPLYEWADTEYSNRSAFNLATGQESSGRSGDPLFVDRAADDFRLSVGSPAIDAAQASANGWRGTDLNGTEPFDDPTVVDGGTGTPPFADLGALEYGGPETP